MPWALPQLDILVAALVALAVCLLVIAFAKAFFGVTGTLLGKLPIIGGWIDATAHHIEQRITHVFGGFAATLEGVVGASWHGMARLVDRIGHAIGTHANLLATLAQFVPGVGVLTTLYRLIREAGSLAARLAHELVGIGNDLGHRIRGVERGIGNDVLPRIRSLDKRLDRVVNRDIAGLRAGEKATAREVGNLWRWTRDHTLIAGSLAFVGAVAVALSRLGLGWLRCSNTRSVGERVCGMDASQIERFLLDTLALVGTVSLVEFIRDAQAVETVALDALGSFIREMPKV